MKAMVLNTYGPDAPFELVEIPDPVSTPGHVVVKVAATSVNPVDTMIHSMGADPPPLKWSAVMVMKTEEPHGEQATEAGRDCLEVTAG